MITLFFRLRSISLMGPTP